MAIGNPITLTNNVASKIISVTATDGQTSFTVTGGYRINQIAVFRNGVQLSQSSDFTANDGSTVTLVSAANVGDTVLFRIFDDFRVADAIQSAAPTQTINGDLTVTGTIVGLTSVTGSAIGIHSGGTTVGTAQTLNFIGTGNTFLDNGDGTIDVSISGGVGAGGTWSNYDGVTGVTTTKKVKIQNNLEVTGVTTSTSGFSGNVTGTAITATTFFGNVTGTAFTGALTGNATGLSGTPDITVRNITGVAATFSGKLSYEDVINVDSVGLITARSGIKIGPTAGVGGTFAADGSYITAGIITATSFSGSGANLTNLPAAGLNTAAGTAAGIVTTLFLSSAQDHKITASGITTITVSGGTEAESHTVRIINSGITTVGFSTYFLFPSGSAPSLPTADGAISLISFTVNRVGAGGTQLLAGASVNFS